MPADLEWLQKNCVTFESPTYEHVAECKSKVRGLVRSCGDDKARKSRMASHFATFLGQSEVFRLGDYYLLWLGNEIFDCISPEDSDKVILSFMEKINRRDEIDAPQDLRDELCGYSIGRLAALTEYKDDIMRPDPDSPGTFTIDWNKWREMEQAIKKQISQP